jgi:hypothetical protein
MTSDSSFREYLVDLYNGYNSIAERVNKTRLLHIHVETALDAEIQSLVSDGNSVVLTGNPGDGKTHLIEILSGQGKIDSGYYEKDASQKESHEILSTWQQKRQDRTPFILAINHAPLVQLANIAEHFEDLIYLKNVPLEIENTIYYNEPQKSSLDSTVIIDLGQRELLTVETVGQLTKTLSSSINNEPCPYCSPPNKCPVVYNASALSNERIVDNLVKMLSLVARRGFHATMRDLTGLLAYLLTGGISCATRWQLDIDDDGHPIQPASDDYIYYNLLFTGRNPLFDAIRATFDPGQYADPQSDFELWNGPVNPIEWAFSDPPVVHPATLADLRKLKRRYFFEHDHDTDALLRRMLPTADFDSLIEGTQDDLSAVEELVEMINTLYSPQRAGPESDRKYRLRLWNSHRYSVGNAPGYMAMRSLPTDKLTIYRPKVAPHLADALEGRRDHVLLGVRRYQPGAPALRVDWPMYQALIAARTGTPLAVQPFYILRRLDLFLRSLGQDVGSTREVETIEWSDHRRRQQQTMRVNRARRQYE